MFISTYLPGLRAAGFPKEARFVHLIFAPVGASKCNFPAFLGNYNRPTSQTTDRPTDKPANIRGSYTYNKFIRHGDDVGVGTLPQQVGPTNETEGCEGWKRSIK